MASQDVSIRLKMVAEGVDQQVQNSQTIANNYASAARSAQQVGSAPQARRAAAAGAMTTSENIEYGRARGNIGGTGASARDFANQAQGLGGLVRLYATFAANIFAVSAAFNALSQAMDTANMVKGLDILGAAAGRSLGTLSQQLVNVTDGAISLREAMSATAMASSAGLTNQQILRMGQVAKTASLALGISMPDAINRLSRGITKLEPELLDELGIFTKIEPAVQAYALQMGKTATQLTDFERRQAFANAVLKEGEDKFSAISDASANPFDKFLAQLKNVTTGGLNLINTVLGPIVDILSQSPAALAGGLALLVTTLVQRALPALGQIREQLAADKVMAQEKLAQKQQDAVKASQALGQLGATKALAEMEANAESELKIFEQKEAKLKELKKNGAAFSQKLNETLKKDIQEVTQFEINQLKIAADARVAAAEAALKKIRGTSAKQETKREAARGEIGAAKAEQETVTALGATVQAEAEYSKAQKQLIDQHVEKMQMSRQYQSLVKAEQKLIVEAKRSEIVANMAYNTSLLGISDAFKIMRAEMDAAGNVGGKVSLGLRGIVAGIGTLISGALGAIGTIIQVVTAAITVFGIIDSLLSKNKKETQAFSDAIDQSESSIKNATKTIELYESKNQNSIQSTVALATAFGELADSMETAVKRFEKMMAASNGWDRFWDRVKGVFGYGKADTLAETLANQLYSALDVAEKFGQRGEMEARLQQFLGIENIFDKRAFEQAIKDLGESGQAELLGIADNFKKRFQQIGSTLDGFRSNLDKTYKSTQEFMQSLSSNDPFAKMAESFGALALDMSRISMLSAGEQLKAFEELTKNPEKLSLFSDSFIKGMFDIKQAFTIEKTQVDAYTSAIDQMIRKVAELKQKQTEIASQAPAPISIPKGMSNLPESIATPGIAQAARASQAVSFGQQPQQLLDKQIKEQEQAIQQYKNIVKEIPTTFTKASELFVEAAQENFKKAADYTAIAIQNSSTRAANTIASAWAATLTGPQAVAEQARIARSEQAIKVKEAKIAVDMLDSQDSLQSAIRENTAQLEITTEALKGTPESKANIAKLEEGRNLQRAIGLISQGKSRDEVLAAIGYDPRNRSLRTDSEGPGSKAAEIFAKAQMQVDIRNQKRDVALGKLKEEQAKQTAINVKEQVDSNAARLQQEKQILDINNATRQARLSIYEIEKQIAGVTTLASINAKAELEDTIRRSNQLAEIDDINRRIKDEDEAVAKTTGESKANHEKQLAFLKYQLLPATEARQITEDQLAARKKILDVLNLEIEAIRKRNEVEKAQLATQQAGQEAQLEIDKARFTSMAEIYNLDKLFVANQIYQMDLQKANFDAQKQQSAALLDAKVKQEEAEKRLQASGLTGLDLQNAITQEQNRQNELLNQQLQQIEIERQKRTDLLKVQQDQVTAQERMNYFMNQANTIAATLSNNFGKGGEKIGQLVDTFAKITKSIDESRGAQEAFNRRAEQMTDDSSADQWRAFWEDKDRLEKKSAQDELERNAMTLNSTKKLFKEKTGAYKAFGALEKAYHIARLIMSAKEIATQIANTVSFVTNSITRQGAAAAEAGVLGVKAVINSMSTLPPPFNFAAGAVMTALVASLLASIGQSFRGGGGNRPSISTEDINKTQGSAMEYNQQGQLVQVRPGVLGDTSAKSDSVRKSISMIEKYTLEGMPINDAQLQYLKLIEKNTKAAAISIYGATGLRTGNIPGIKGAGTAPTTLGNIASASGAILGGGGGALLGAAIAGQGLLLGGTVGSILGEGLAVALNMALPGIGLVLGAVLGKGLMSQSVTRTIEQSGISFSGDLEALAKDTDNAIMAFASGIDKTTTKYLWGLAKSSKTKPFFTETQLTELEQGQQILDSLRPIFATSYKSITGLATELGYSAEKINAAIKQQEFTVNFKDLKTSEEIGQALYDGINAYLDTISNTLFEEFKSFRKEGEGMFETVQRVRYQFELVSQGLKNIGVSTDYLFKTIEGYGIADMITEVFGGMEAFIDKTEKFRKAFLTEAEQLAPIQQMVTDTLKKLGFANVDTMEEFKQLVQSIKPVTPEAAQLQNTLLELAPAFEKVYKGADDLLENLRKETINLTTTLSADEIILRDITIKTNEYVETLKASGVATEKNIKIVADWAKASALTQLRNNLKSAYEDRKRELESSISALEKVKNSLVDFKTQLLRGELSPESTLSKFEQLRAEYDVLLQDVRSSDSSVAEKAAEKFPQLSTQLLDTAKTLYGSGELYQTLHDKILKDLDTTTTIVNTKLTDAQQQLEELTKQGVTLGFIEQNTKTTAEKFSEYLRLYNAVNAINTATVGANAAAAIASGNTVNSSMLNAYQNELITNIPEIKITPLELTSEAAAAKKKADEEAAAAAAAKKKADEEAAAAAKKSNELAQELKNAIDAQTAILTTVISNTGSDTVTAVKNNTWIKTGTFGVVMEER